MEDEDMSIPAQLPTTETAENSKDIVANEPFFQRHKWLLICYLFGTIATVIKTVAWWFNQWPPIYNINFFAKWSSSAAIAGFEYAPLTLSFQTANARGVHLSLMTAYMEAADNLFRMLQQLFLSDPLEWFDWIGALGLGLCVAWQGYMHWADDRKRIADKRMTRQEEEDALEKRDEDDAKRQTQQRIPVPSTPASPRDASAFELSGGLLKEDNEEVISNALDFEETVNRAEAAAAEEVGAQAGRPVEVPHEPVGNGTPVRVQVPPASPTVDVLPPRADVFLLGLDKERFFIFVIGVTVLVVGSPTIALEAGPTGQAYVCATLATAAKTFAWWINQYPQLKHLDFYRKWLAGWSIAAFIEYLPLIGAFTIASENDVYLGLMTAYMEALDNFFRILQQRMLKKPLAWYDYTAAAGMFLSVGFQAATRFAYDHGANIPT